MILLSSIDEPEGKGSLRRALLRRNVKFSVQSYPSSPPGLLRAEPLGQTPQLGIGRPPGYAQSAVGDVQRLCDPTGELITLKKLCE